MNLFQRLDALFLLPSDEISKALHPDFIRYLGGLCGVGTAEYAQEMEFYLRQTGWSGRVLDIGCGYGLADICLRAYGVSEVVGIDVSALKVETARKLAELVKCEGVSFKLSNTQLEFPNGSFDGVLIKDALSHMSEDSPVLAEAYRFLKPGGRFVNS